MENLIYITGILGLLLAIVFSCLFFANAVENLGHKLSLGNQVTGSILAAVGTALPETIVPLVAIFMAYKASTGTAHVATSVLGSSTHQIAVGAIVGAPFMLSTLALLVVSITMFLFRKRRGSLELHVHNSHVKRDLSFFLTSFLLLVLASFLTMKFKIFIAILLSLKYGFYLIKTIKAGQEEEDTEEEVPHLYLSLLKFPSNTLTIAIQILIGLYGIIFFAEKFVHLLEEVSSLWSISPMVLSLIVTPVATELPEKVNSCFWVSQKKDTLAMGNITGAMVFQTTVPGTIGLLLTPWKFDFLAYSCAIIAVISTSLLLFEVIVYKKLTAKFLLISGSLYLVYIYLAFFACTNNPMIPFCK